MRSTLILASLASLSSVALAQNGYGRFPCTIVNGDGTYSADQTQCANDALIAPGADTTEDTGNQGDGPTPVNPVCAIDSQSGLYYCGIAGATCTSDENCDNGFCDTTTGTCSGGRNAACEGADTNCSGYLYCTDLDGAPTDADTCGGLGSFCQDYALGDNSQSNAANYALFNGACSSGYCNFNLGVCDTHATEVGADCSSDSDFACTTSASTGEALTCDPTTLTCVVAAAPSGYARQRRNRALFKKSMCPAAHSACQVPNSKGFECIDTQTNLEQCGACASMGGVDCTTLPGVEAVGCSNGICEIWSCAEGFSYDASSNSCLVSV
ncbi:hypothetical protein JCM11641_001349 [Rhodosporidiobolus odoratus]